MTDEEAFNILQFAEDMSHKNWKQFRLLYNNKFKEAEYRIKELEAALREIIQKDAFTGETVFVGDYGKIARAALGEKADG